MVKGCGQTTGDRGRLVPHLLVPCRVPAPGTLAGTAGVLGAEISNGRLWPPGLCGRMIYRDGERPLDWPQM